MISATSTIDGDALKLTVLHHWRNHGRHDLPWRHTDNPYHILVSEIMLQQTQVPRVIDRYSEFLRVFPSFRVLATATPAAVLKVWQGLGYNRRALMLLRCARAVVDEHASSLPTDREALESLPGIGPYTAGAIMAFAFDAPVAMIETNIRRVYIHHYFPRRRSVPDADILPLVARDVSRVSSAKVL
jgi:A/G-specific adenine glycosylase